MVYPAHAGPYADARKELQVMNELALHRGDSSHLTTIDVFVDGQHLTEAVVRRPHLAHLPESNKHI